MQTEYTFSGRRFRIDSWFYYEGETKGTSYIHHLLTGWGADPADAVMVGDYLFDLQAGRSVVTTTVHVGRPDGKSWPEFTDLAVASLTDLALHFQQ